MEMTDFLFDLFVKIFEDFWRSLDYSFDNIEQSHLIPDFVMLTVITPPKWLHFYC